MKNRRLAASTPDRFATASTGHHCPKTGWWSLERKEEATTFITEGQVMPAVGGVPTVWILRETANYGHAGVTSLPAAS
ncbi:hypothetical protein ACLRGI_07640 [Paenarthrobacter nitroguajacolicus]|uniref:hypothetical protein n=1 Tax=Paenarthrobacter nitroguajacolicus TaxID=211146 RepID=UPI003AEB280B